MMLFVIVVLILANAAGTFAGLLLCSHLGLGFGFGDLKYDVLRCLALAAIVLLPACGLFCWAPHPGVILPFLIVWFIVIKLLWLELQNAEIVVTGVVSLSATMVAAQIIMQSMGD